MSKHILAIIDTSDVASVSLSTLSQQIVDGCQKSNTALGVLNEGAYLIPWLNGMLSLNILVTLVLAAGFRIRVLVVDDADFLR